jgi:hypothetical protein
MVKATFSPWMRRAMSTAQDISLLINHWNRPDNVKRILEQQVGIADIAEIILFNNNKKSSFHCEHPKVRILNSNYDFGLRTRWIMGALATNDVLVFQDDDIMIGEVVFKAFLSSIRQDSARAYSLHGRNLGGMNEYNFQDAFGEVDIVLTRAACIHKRVIPHILKAEYEFYAAARRYPKPIEFPGDDIFLSCCMSALYGKKHVALCLPHENLPDENALSMRCGREYQRTRTEIMRTCQMYFAKRQPRV